MFLLIRLFLILLLVLLFCTSCNRPLWKINDKQCYFDSKNLKVYFLDSKDTIFNIKNVGFSLAFQYLDFGNLNQIVPEYINVSKNEILNKKFSFTNIGCKDTIWARQKIKEELKKRCPFYHTFKDTFCLRHHYNIKLVDSTLLIKSKHLSYDVSAYISGDGLENWIEHIGVEFKDIGQILIPNKIEKDLGTPCEKSIGHMLDSLSGRYDFKDYFTFNEKIGEEARFKLIRDSLGFEISKIKEEKYLYKIIRYMKK